MAAPLAATGWVSEGLPGCLPRRCHVEKSCSGPLVGTEGGMATLAGLAGCGKTSTPRDQM